MTGWWNTQACLAYDCETTGVDVHNDRIVTAAVVRIVPGKKPVSFTWLADPGIEIPDEAAAVHGISTEHARAHGRPSVEVVGEITDHLVWAFEHGIPVVAANAAFDLTILDTEGQRQGLDSLCARVAVAPVIDPMVLDKHADPYRKGNCPHCAAVDKKLTSLCTHYGVTLTNAHTAEADAIAAGLLWTRILDQHRGKFRGLDLAGLHRAQVGWRQAQCDSLRQYFDRQGTVHDGVPGDWPILPPVAQTALLGGVA